MEEKITYEWMNIDPFTALEEGKLSLEAKIITRVYSSDFRFGIQKWIGGIQFMVIIFCIYSWFPSKSNTWLWVAGLTFILGSICLGVLGHILSKYKVLGKIIFHDHYAVIAYYEQQQKHEFLYSDLRSIIHDDDESVMRIRKSKNKYLDHIPVRFILQGKLRHRLELSCELENFTDHKIRLTYNPTLEEVLLWIYPDYETFDKARRNSKTRLLSN